MSSFRIGQKVVCVDTWPSDLSLGYGDEAGPVRGGIYTIRNFDTDLYGQSACRLVEIKNKRRQYTNEKGKRVMWEQSFYTHRFRPLVEKKTDISIFTKMLEPKREERLA